MKLPSQKRFFEWQKNKPYSKKATLFRAGLYKTNYTKYYEEEGVYRLSQYETPLFTALVEHSKRNPIQFHIPGHKKGQGMDPTFREFIGHNALAIDLINIAPLDDLHHPKV